MGKVESEMFKNYTVLTKVLRFLTKINKTSLQSYPINLPICSADETAPSFQCSTFKGSS